MASKVNFISFGLRGSGRNAEAWCLLTHEEAYLYLCVGYLELFSTDDTRSTVNTRCCSCPHSHQAIAATQYTPREGYAATSTKIQYMQCATLNPKP